MKKTPATPADGEILMPIVVATQPWRFVAPGQPDSLAAWIQRYGAVEAGANADNTLKAKGRDLVLFMRFFTGRVATDHPDDWTRPVTAAFLRWLENDEGKKATTVNRALSTLRHCSGWIHRHRPFLAGDPCGKIKELITDEPAWKGLSDVEVMRLRSAAEQLARIKTRGNQNPLRDLAAFLLLLHTGLRVSELVGLDLGQYRSKHLHDVKRKGKVRTTRVIVPPDARDALDRYLADERPSGNGPLLRSRAGERLGRQHIDRLLKQLSAHANSKLPPDQQIAFSAHTLRHTFLRKITQKHGVEFAMESAGHASSKYIWRYVKPSEEQKEKAMEDLF